MASNVSSQDGDIGFQIAPMVDVVFVLMLFFMAFAAMRSEEQWLRVNLPSYGQGSISAIVVTIAADGSVALNDRAIGSPADRELPELREWFRMVRADFGEKDVVVIRPDHSVRHERLMDVLSAIRTAGVTRLTFN